MDLFRFFWRELKLSGARVYEAQDFDQAIELAATGTLPLDESITDVRPWRVRGRHSRYGTGWRMMKILVRCTE